MHTLFLLGFNWDYIMKYFIVLMVLFSQLMLSSANIYAASASDVSMDETQYNEAEFNRVLLMRMKSGQQDTPELRKSIKDAIDFANKAYKAALKNKINHEPEVAMLLARAEREILANLYISRINIQPITQDQLMGEYKKSVDQLNPSEFKLKIIVVADEKTIKTVRSEFANGVDFSVLAKKYSKVSSAANGGNIGWVNVGNNDSYVGALPKTINAEVRKTNKGSFTTPVSDANGNWWLVLLEDSRPAQIISFEKVKSRLELAMQKEQRLKAARAQLQNEK